MTLIEHNMKVKEKFTINIPSLSRTEYDATSKPAGVVRDDRRLTTEMEGWVAQAAVWYGPSNTSGWKKFMATNIEALTG